MSPNKDKTGNDRQRRRREREKIWLKEHGFSEWAEVHLAYFGYSSLEALHTALMNDETSLTPLALDGAIAPDNQQVSPADVLVGEGTLPEPPRQ